MTKLGFFKTMLVTLKAVLVNIVFGIIVWIISILLPNNPFEAGNLNMLFIIIMLVVYLFLWGWLANAMWKWE